jgi:hypothetical protein
MKHSQRSDEGGEMLRLILAGSVAVLTILMAVACGGGDSPTSTAAQDGSGGSEVTAAPTSTAAQDDSGGSEVTGSKYAAYCGEIVRDSNEGEDEPKTWGEAVQYGDRALDHLENVTAPEELKNYHNAVIALVKAYSDFYRRQDASESVDIALPSQDDEIVAKAGTLLDFSSALDSETVSQMRDAGCVL